jgi:hypothetical protein
MLLYVIDPSQNSFVYGEFLIGYLFYNGLIQYNTQTVLGELQSQGLFDDLLATISPSTLTNLLFGALQNNVDPSLNSPLQLLDPSASFVDILGTIQADLSYNSLFQLLDPSANLQTLIGTILYDLSLNSPLQLLDPSTNWSQVIGTIVTDLSLNSVLQLLDPSVNLVQLGTSIIGAVLGGNISGVNSILDLLGGVTPVQLFSQLMQNPDISANALLNAAFEQIDLLALFASLSQNVAINPNLVNDLSLNSLLSLLDPSGNLIQKVVANTYLIRYLFSKGIINVNSFVPQFIGAIQTTPQLLANIIPYVNFPALKADPSGNELLLASFDVDVFVGANFAPLLKYLPDIIEQVEPQDLFLYTDAQRVSKFITDNPDIITSLIQPSTILQAIQSDQSALNSLINIERLIRNLQYNPDLLPLFTNLNSLFTYIIEDPSDNQLLIRLFNNQNFAIFVDNDPSFLTYLLDIDQLLADLSGNTDFAFLFDGSGNVVIELAELTQQYPLILLFLVKYLDPAKISALVNTNPDLLFQFVNVNELLVLVQQGIIPFDRLIDAPTLVTNLEGDSNLVGLLLDISTIKQAIESDVSGNIVGSLLDRGVLKTFIKSIPIEQIQEIINVDAFTDPSNNKWLNYFDMAVVTSDPEIQAILPNIIRPEIFTNQDPVFPGVNNVEFLLDQDPSKNFINVLGLLGEPAIVSVLLDASSNSFQILQLLFGSFGTLLGDISGNINLLYSFISLFDDTSLFGLLANPQLLNTINETILRGIFKALPLEVDISNNREIFSQFLIGDISGNTSSLIQISTILDEQKTLEAFRTNVPADVLGDFINLITLETIQYGIQAQIADPSSNFIESFFKSSLGEGTIGTNFAASIFQQFSGESIGVVLQFIDFTSLLQSNIGILFNYISFVDSSGNVNPSILSLVNLENLFANPNLFLSDLSNNPMAFDILLSYLFTVVSPNQILNEPSLPSNSYLLDILYVYGETVNNVYIPGILDISNASVFVDPSFNWLPYIKKDKLLSDISNNPAVLSYFVDLETMTQDPAFLGVMLTVIPPQRFVEILTTSDPSLNILNTTAFSTNSLLGLLDIPKLLTDVSNNVVIDASGVTIVQTLFSNFRLSEFIIALYQNPLYQSYLLNAIATIDINTLRSDLSNNRTTIINDISNGVISLSDFASLITTSGLQQLVSSDPQKVLDYFNLVDINLLVQLIEDNPRFFLSLLPNDGLLTSIIDFSTLTIDGLLEDASLISGLLGDATTDPSSNLLSALFSNEVMIDVLFKTNPIKDVCLNDIPDNIVDREFLQTLGYLPIQLKALDPSNNPLLDTNVLNFTLELNKLYSSLIPDSLQDFATQPIFRPLFLGFTQAFLDVSSNQNIFLFTENDPDLQVREYITIKDISSNIVYGPYPIIVSEVINNQKLLKIQVDASFNPLYQSYRPDASGQYIINNFYNSSLAVTNVNEYKWREYYKQSYDVLSLSVSIIPVIETLVSEFQESKTVLPDRNTVAEDMIIIGINSDTYKTKMTDASDVVVPSIDISTSLVTITEKLSFLPILNGSYVNLRKVHHNRTQLSNALTYTSNIYSIAQNVDISCNAVIANMDTNTVSTIGTNAIIDYGNAVTTLVNYSSTLVSLIDLINTCITDINFIAANITNSQQLATFNSQTSVIKNSDLTNTIRQSLVDLSNNPLPYITDASSNINYIVNAFRSNPSFLTKAAVFNAYYNSFGNIKQLDSQTDIIDAFILDLSNNVTPTMTDLSDSIVRVLDASLNIAQTDAFLASVDGYVQWLDISLNLTTITSLVQQMKQLENSPVSYDSSLNKVRDPSGNINVIALYEKKLGTALPFDISVFDDPTIGFVTEFILGISQAKTDVDNLIRLIDVGNLAALIADTSANTLLSGALDALLPFFTNLSFVSIYAASLPPMSSIIVNKPSTSDLATSTAQLFNKFVYFAAMCDWINNSLNALNLGDIRTKINTMRNILNTVKNPASPLNNTLGQLEQVPALTTYVQSLQNKFAQLDSGFDVTDISLNYNNMDTLQVIKGRNILIGTAGDAYTSISTMFTDLSTNLTGFHNVSYSSASFDDINLPISTYISKITNYNRLVSKWPTLLNIYDRMVDGYRNFDYVYYFEAQLRRLYTIVTIKENLDILDFIEGNNNQVGQWLQLGARQNSVYVLASDQNDFLQLNDWVFLQNQQQQNSYPVIINDVLTVLYKNDKYKIIRMVWKANTQIIDVNNRYTIEGGIGNFIADYDVLHERVFFDVYSNYQFVKEFSPIVLSYVDTFTDYSTQYTIQEYMRFILTDILRNPPTNIHMNELPNSIMARVYNHGFGSINLINETGLNTIANTLSSYVDTKEANVRLIAATLNRPLVPTVAWVDYLGHFLASKIELMIDDQPLQVLTSDWLQICYNTNVTDGQKRGYNIMIGNTPALTTPSAYIPGGTRLYISLPFYFHKRPSSSLPLIAMFNSSLYMKVHLRTLKELLHIPATARVTTRGDMKIVMLGKYAYLGDVERKLFAESRHEYIIEQVQYRVNSVDTVNINDKIHFMNPVKDMFFFYQSAENLERKQYQNYTLNTRDNPFKRIALKLNGHDRFDCDGMQTGYVYPFDRYQTTFAPGLNVYSFCLFPEDGQPSGACNLSYITDKELRYELEEVKDGVIKVFARSYNLLRVMGGTAGIGF